MRISRLYIAHELQAQASVELTGPNAHYLSNVLRLSTGTLLRVFNGDGHEYSATITAMHKQHVTLQLNAAETPTTESPLHTVLGLGISRGERMDYAIQKSTELGVSVIAPLFTEHCEVKLQGERIDKRLAHWQQIAISACEQCGRVQIPTILPPQPLASWLTNVDTDLRLLLDHEEAGRLDDARPQNGVSLLIGPEGGLTSDEISAAKSAGFTGIALGRRVLRTETAPVVALAVLQYLWG
jgi:16S rRNA (uracil1498-N3)-methyltransferase